jgi:hypothetical protein
VFWTPQNSEDKNFPISFRMPPHSEALTFFYQVKSIPLWILNTSINPINPKQKGKKTEEQ